MLAAAIVAGILVTHTSTYVQKKWHLYDVFIGKKFAFIVHCLLLSFVWLEVIAVSFFVRISTWSFPAMPIIGVPLLAAALYKLYLELRTGIIKEVIYIKFFKSTKKKNDYTVQDSLKFYLSVAAVYLSIMLATGSIGYLFGILGFALAFAAHYLQHRFK